MTTVSDAIGPTADDAHESSSGFSYGTSTAWAVGSGDVPMYRFPEVAIPQGATISSASLTTYHPEGGVGKDSQPFTDCAFNWTYYGHKVTNSAAHPGTSGYQDFNISARAKTTASENSQSGGHFGSGSGNPHAHSHGCTSIVQELVNQAGWTTASPITIGLNPALNYGSYAGHFNFLDMNASYPSYLTVTYTYNAPPTATLLSPNDVAIGIALSGYQLSATATDPDGNTIYLEWEIRNNATDALIATSTTAAQASATTFNINPGTALDGGTTYKWRVRPIDTGTPSATGSWTAYRTFTTTVGPVTSDLRWKVRKNIQATSDLRWKVRKFIATAAADLRWKVLGRVATTSDLRWKVIQSIKATADLRWKVAAAVAALSDLRWRVLNPVAPVTVDLRWTVIGPVLVLADLRWNAQATVPVDADLRWAVSSSVPVVTTDLRWKVRGMVGVPAGLLWQVRTLAATSVDLRWRVRQMVQRTVDLRWDVEVLNNFFMWDGATWVRVPFYYWDGAMWKLVRAKRWDGAGWVDV